MKHQFIGGEDEILIKTERIHPMLKFFLRDCDFAVFWSKIRRHAKDEKTLTRQFNDWFDGFKTLKFINYFTKEVYPLINMFEALERILSLLEMTGLKIDSETKIPQLGEQIKILQYLRTVT
jgi:HSP20 family molecular chaperone IbpA